MQGRKAIAAWLFYEVYCAMLAEWLARKFTAPTESRNNHCRRCRKYDPFHETREGWCVLGKVPRLTINELRDLEKELLVRKILVYLAIGIYNLTFSLLVFPKTFLNILYIIKGILWFCMWMGFDKILYICLMFIYKSNKLIVPLI